MYFTLVCFIPWLLLCKLQTYSGLVIYIFFKVTALDRIRGKFMHKRSIPTITAEKMATTNRIPKVAGISCLFDGL
jgi:hypothetical protein